MDAFRIKGLLQEEEITIHLLHLHELGYFKHFEESIKKEIMESTLWMKPGSEAAVDFISDRTPLVRWAIQTQTEAVAEIERRKALEQEQ